MVESRLFGTDSVILYAAAILGAPQQAKIYTKLHVQRLGVIADNIKTATLEIVRRLHQENKFRPESDQLPVPSKRTIYREIARKSPYELTLAPHATPPPVLDFSLATTAP